MVPISQRRRHSRRRMFFIFVIFLGLFRHCELAPARKLSDSGGSSASATLSGGSSGSKRFQDLGSPSDLAWQAWLLLDPQTGAHSSLDSASFLRRITPKSVFIAPALPACSDGYRADTMGRCVKTVNIDQEAHIDFLLQRLNAMWANRGDSGSSNKDQKQSSGPLQVTIPLLSNVNQQAVSVDHEETRDSMEVPVVVPPQGSVHLGEKKDPPEIIASYKVKNDTVSENLEDGNRFFLGISNSSTSVKDNENNQKSDAVVPVAEFVDDANETSFSEVVDYKIPIDLKSLLNVSNVKINVTDDLDALKNGTHTMNSTEISPTLILLLSPTILPTAAAPDVDDPQPDNNNSTDDREIVKPSNAAANVTDREIISTSTPEPAAPTRFSVIPLVVVDKTENNETLDEGMSEVPNPGASESQEVEAFYDDEEGDDEDYGDSTDLPDEESTELDGEILKHGEAGMPIPVKNVEPTHRKNETTRFNLLDDIFIRFNDSSPTDREEKDEAGSNVSSEVSIDGDIILETTLLNVNTEKMRNNSKLPDANRTSNMEEEDEYLKKLFEPEKEPDSQPEVIFSSQNLHGTVSTRSHSKKRGDQGKTEIRFPDDPKSEELEAASSSSESLLFDPRSRNQYSEEGPIRQIHTVQDSSANREILFPEDPKDSSSSRPIESENPVNYKPLTSNFRPTQDYIRFSNYGRQPMKFPSEEVNSIHNQDYKERVLFPHDDGLHSSTKSSVFVHQKPSYRGVSRSKTTNRQQTFSPPIETTPSSHRLKRPLSFVWRGMPLSRDPSLYSTDLVPHSKTLGGQQRPSNRFPEVSPS